MPLSATSVTPNSPPTIKTLHNLVETDLRAVDKVILEYVESDISLIPQMARYIVAAGGKRLRPALTLACARLCGYEGDRHVKLAACVEFIHTATLLHDDVVDASHLRRGSATANDVWGNKSSVLVGDFLLSRSFQLMVSDGSLEVLRILSDASAVIAEGEVKQLMTSNKPETGIKSYLEVVTAKTATLFAAAAELGAVVSDMPEHQANLREFGLALGIAFQIMDDALDYAASQEKLGKTVGDDFRDGKVTLPVILAYADGSEEERSFWQRTLGEQELEEGDLDRAIAYINKYDAIGRAIEIAENYCQTAKEKLSSFPPCPLHDALVETVNFCVKREY